MIIGHWCRSIPFLSVKDLDQLEMSVDLDDDLEWEEWNPAKLTFIHHMIAGSSAGLAEHVSMVSKYCHTQLQ